MKIFIVLYSVVGIYVMLTDVPGWLRFLVAAGALLLAPHTLFYVLRFMFGYRHVHDPLTGETYRVPRRGWHDVPRRYRRNRRNRMVD